MKEKDRLSLLKKTSNLSAPEAEQKQANKNKQYNSSFRSRKGFGRKLLQAGILLPTKLYVVIILVASCWMIYLGSFLGAFFGIFLGVAFMHYMFTGYIDNRIYKRGKKIVPHLPPFIDGLASSLSTGFNIQEAIVQATQGVPQGLLRTELDRVSDALEKGFSVKDSMSILRDRIAGREVISIVVSLTLFANMGGHVLEPFRRLARKIREQQAVVDKASRDLVMVKQAFNLIFLLAVLIPGILLLISPGYFTEAFHDSVGRLILQFAAVLILTSLIFFKRLTNLKI